MGTTYTAHIETANQGEEFKQVGQYQAGSFDYKIRRQAVQEAMRYLDPLSPADMGVAYDAIKAGNVVTDQSGHRVRIRETFVDESDKWAVY